MSRKLIVNADGFGFTYGNNRGILECLAAGVIKSVSVNSNFPAFEETGRLREFPDVSVGVHLDLSVGPCVSDPASVPDLVNEKGEFLGVGFHKKALRGLIPHEQMVRELRAQVKKFEKFGITLTHWDSHQNMHLYPPFFQAAVEVAREFGIQRMRTHYHYLFTNDSYRGLRATAHLVVNPRRAAIYWHSNRMMRRAKAAGFRMAERLISVGVIGGMRKFQPQFWLELFDRLPDGVSELYCHPGYPDTTLEGYAKYVFEREEELKILREPELAKEAARRGVELISFNEI